MAIFMRLRPSRLRKIIDFGRAKYATVELKRGKWLYVATQRIKAHTIDWQKLTRQALTAKVEAQ